MLIPRATSRLLSLSSLIVGLLIAGCTYVIDGSTVASPPNSSGSATPEPTETPLSPAAATATVEASVGTQSRELVVLTNSIWGQTTIDVCWDTQGFDVEKTWVRDAVTDSWPQVSTLKFIGWQECDLDSAGIRITINDEGPHVKALGRFLNKRKDGMVLNFTFLNWSLSCASPEDRRQFCIKAIAVHEFGHGIGLAHEANREDAPQWCRDRAQGLPGDWLVTPFDLNSIMNYCNPQWNNAGILSELDVVGTQTLYGRPQEIIDGDDESVTQRNTLHACPEGSYVVGVQVIKNVLLCSNEIGTYLASEEFVDGDDEPPTQRNGMHACPVGSAVTGIHVDNDWLSCAPIEAIGDSEFVNDGDNEEATVRGTMHACPVGTALVGIHIDNDDLNHNDFLCEQVAE